MGDSLILMGFINLIGIIIILEFRDRSWFKKENFKIQKTNVMAQNKLTLKKMAKEMGVTLTPQKQEPAGTLDTIKMLAPILQNLDPDTVGLLADRFLGGEDADTDRGFMGIPQGVIDSAIKGIVESQTGKGELNEQEALIGQTV